jgi:predicted O-methyltransferase YrrM
MIVAQRDGCAHAKHFMRSVQMVPASVTGQSFKSLPVHRDFEVVMFGLPFKYIMRHPARGLGAVLSEPLGTWERIYEDHCYTVEQRLPPYHYQANSDWEAQLHIELGTECPCIERSEPTSLWPAITATLAARGIEVGPLSFFHWNDGDPAFIRAIWCLIRHLKPERVVETGIAHGVSSRFILEALKLNGTGKLWSIDLPPIEHHWRDRVGIAVSEEFYDRWRLIKGSSRRNLIPLMRELGTLDLFIHDSLHSGRNVSFELEEAWRVLRPGGAIVVDDVDANSAFHEFTTRNPEHFSVVCEAEPVRPDIRRFNKKCLFGIIIRRSQVQPSISRRSH